ncbi:hypothetical protein B9J78_01420 [bacterium Unc6]|nr:hypothetical protein [bacterium Unc6]
MNPREIFVEVSHGSLTKHNEEVCGDNVMVKRVDDGSTIVVMSDGLGSGIKASILATLTTRIIATMLEKGVNLKEVVETLAETLPVCQVRKLAYSTFTILRISSRGEVVAFEYGNPEPFFIHQGRLNTISGNEYPVGGIKISESYFPMDRNDYLVIVSDGIVHAGLGKVWSMGWQRERVGKFLEEKAGSLPSASSLTRSLLDTANSFYEEMPGDDATCVVINSRLFQRLIAMIGPPLDVKDDENVVNELVNFDGIKVVCGGSTTNIVARILKEELIVDISSMCNGIPPTGILKGIDLVTEGILTLSGALEQIKGGVVSDELVDRRDGASRLAKVLLSADSINFVVGQTINPAHQNPNMPSELVIKRKIVESIASLLREKGKRVTMEYC